MGVRLCRIAEGVTRRVPHGEVITRQGDQVASLYLVMRGAVRLSWVTTLGRELVAGILGPGELFGECALLGDPSPVRAEAVAPTTIMALPVRSLRAVIERYPETGEELLRLIAARLHRTSSALEAALVDDVPTRVAGRLRQLADDHGVPSPDGVWLRVAVSQEELARMVGASRESVNRIVGSLAARGLVRSVGPRRLVIADPVALGRAASR